ncbi:MAG TPA: D-amino-acid transaminase [Rhizomicrobium sp.]|nr:D-amino-acid transaminase [Rhizomicrobium sp.]
MTSSLEERDYRWPARSPVGRIAYVNGRYLPHAHATVHIEDRALQFADGIYEVVGLFGGRLFDEEEHLDRLERSVRETGMAMPMGRAALRQVIREVARRNGVTDGLVYMQVTRGAHRRDHPVPERAGRPTLIVTARSLDPTALARRRQDGVAVVTRPDERWARCDIKSTALLPNILAKTAARKAGAHEAWLVDRDGFVTEGSSTSAWIVDKDGHIVTRDLSHAILPGVTRRVILEAAKEGQISVTERKFRPEEAARAREAFLTAASAGIVPVVAIDGRPVGTGTPGPVTARIRELYERRAAARAG